MDIREVIISQYLASLEMLKETVVQCPDSLWADQQYTNEFWHTVYHALVYTHLYLQPEERAFIPWSQHREGYHRMDKGVEPYRKDEILEYIEICSEQVKKQVPALDLDAPSGFDWLPFNKLELQFYNIRHLQHHTGELFERLGTTANIEVHWVGTKPA